MKSINLKSIYQSTAIVLIILLVIMSGVIISLSVLKYDAIDTNLKIADFHANSLSEQINQTFINSDLIINDLSNTIKNKNDFKALEYKFENILSNNPYIRSISILDDQKTIIYSSNPKNLGVKILSSNFYPIPMFNQQILRFGNPWIGRDFNNAEDITFLSSVNKKNSSFLPIIKKITIDNKDHYIAININSDYFINKYATNLENSYARLEIIRIDGMLLFSSDPNRQVGIQVDKTPLIDEANLKSQALGIETVEDRKYLTSYRLTNTFPLNIVVGLDFEKTLTSWEEKRLIIIAVITCLVLFCIILVIALIYRYSREKHHELELQKTAQKNLKAAKELAEKANNAKSEFLANMSHEIRTPLNAIIGLTELVLQSPLDAKQKDYLQKAQKSSNTLLNLINDILDYSKIEAQKLTLEKHEFKLDDVIDSIRDLFEYQANSRGIALVIDTPAQLNLIGDSLRLRQVLTNIVGNAIKFTEQGFVKLCIKAREQNDGYVSLHFSVKDSGIGMSEEAQENLFKKFTQADSSITRQHGGTGLGLSISKQLVELMGGKISLVSSLGVGSEFMFDIKLLKAKSASPEEIEKPTHDLSRFDSLQVLLVEDNHINQIVAAGMLENLGLSVEIANNGKEAVDKAKAQKYDLILMDIQMPVMDGYEATRKIREFDKDIPIIALSAAIMPEDKEKSEQAGMDAHLGKPIRQEQLSEAILKHVQHETFSGKAHIPDDLDVVVKSEFYGVDMDELKHRIGDKPETIKQLLLSFCEDYASPEEKFDASEVETESFSKAMHALKGVSGNISLNSIFQLSKKIYESDSNAEKSKLTIELIDLLKKTRANLMLELDNTSTDAAEPRIDYNKKEVELFLQELLADLEQFIAITPERINTALQVLNKQADPQEIASIKRDLDNYVYEEASKKINRIYNEIMLADDLRS